MESPKKRGKKNSDDGNESEEEWKVFSS